MNINTLNQPSAQKNESLFAPDRKIPGFTKSGIYFVLALIVSPLLYAQDQDLGEAESNEEVVSLSPFVIATDQDIGWIASSTLIGNRTNELLVNVPISVDAITTEFMHDFDAHTLNDVSRFVANLDVVDDNQRLNDDKHVNFRGMRFGGRLGRSFPLSSRNFFVWFAPTDNYNVERIDFNKGSNTLIFGDAPPGGQATTYTKRARFNNFGSFLAKYASEDTFRVQFDINRMINEKLAVRLNLVSRADRSYIDFTDSQFKAIDGALTYKPFKNTIIRFEAEAGQFDRIRGENRVRIRDESAEGRGFDRIDNKDRWYFTSDGDLFNPFGEIVIDGTGSSQDLDSKKDSQGTSGDTNSLLEGQTVTVKLKDRVGGKNVFTGETVDFTGFNKSFNIRGDSHFLNRPYTNVSLWVEQRFGDLNLEFAYSQQNQYQERHDSSFGTRVSVDSDGRPYVETDFDDKKFGDRVKTVRVTASYPFKLGDWMQQYVVVTGTYLENLVYTKRQRLVNFAVVDDPDLTIKEKQYRKNRIRLRAYLDGPDVTSGNFWQQFNLDNLPNTDDFRADFYEYTIGLTPMYRKRYFKTFMVSAQGNYFDGRFRTLLGFSNNNFALKRLTDIPTTEFGEVIRLGGPDHAPEAYTHIPELDISGTSITTGLIVRLTPSINLYGVFSESFQWQGAVDFENNVLGPVTGETREFGLKGSLFDNTLIFTLAGYQVDRENSVLRWSPNELNEEELEELFNLPGVEEGDPGFFDVAGGANQEHRTVSSSESSEGFEATVFLTRVKGLQARLTFAYNDIAVARDFSRFKFHLDAAIARGGEDPEDIADAQEILAENEGVITVTGSRGKPYAVNWVFDYEFGENTFLKNTRVALYGNWSDNYIVDIEDEMNIRGGSRHPVSLYIIHKRKIRDYNVSFRLGIKDMFDFENNEDFRETGVVDLDDDGFPIFSFRYINPTTVDFTVIIGF